MIQRVLTYGLLALIVIAAGTKALNAQESTGWGERVQYQISGVALLENDKTTPGIELTAWYFLKPKVGLGPSISYLDYDSALDEKMLNVGIDALFLTNDSKRFRPYGAFNSGVGFPVYNSFFESESPLSSRLFIAPRVGFYIISDRGVAFNIGMGYVHQGLDADFAGSQTDLRISYSRYTLSLGLAF